MSLVQHLYEQSSGKVLIDGREVHQLCPEWVRTGGLFSCLPSNRLLTLLVIVTKVESQYIDRITRAHSFCQEYQAEHNVWSRRDRYGTY